MIGVSLVAMFSLFSPPAAAEDCLELGWSGGSAGSNGISYVRAHLVRVDESTGSVVLRYDHKNGQLFLNVTEDGWSSMSFRGTWTQDGGKSGAAYLHFSDQMHKGVGYWTSGDNPARHDLFLRECQ